MKVFNLAEELEKERKKNKELEEKIKKLEITKMALVPQYSELKEYNAILQDRINSALSYIEEATKYPRGMGLEPLDEIYADNIVDILKGDNK